MMMYQQNQQKYCTSCNNPIHQASNTLICQNCKFLPHLQHFKSDNKDDHPKQSLQFHNTPTNHKLSKSLSFTMENDHNVNQRYNNNNTNQPVYNSYNNISNELKKYETDQQIFQRNVNTENRQQLVNEIANELTTREKEIYVFKKKQNLKYSIFWTIYLIICIFIGIFLKFLWTDIHNLRDNQIKSIEHDKIKCIKFYTENQCDEIITSEILQKECEKNYKCIHMDAEKNVYFLEIGVEYLDRIFDDKFSKSFTIINFVGIGFFLYFVIFRGYIQPSVENVLEKDVQQYKKMEPQDRKGIDIAAWVLQQAVLFFVKNVLPIIVVIVMIGSSFRYFFNFKTLYQLLTLNFE